MTGLLRDLMHTRADSLHAPDLDVAAMVRAGDRTVRRRRTAVVGGLAALTVAAAVALPSLLPSDRARESTTVAGALAAHDPVWAVGSTLHVGGSTIDAGAPVVALIASSAGVAYTDAEGGVWSVTDAGAPARVGAVVRAADARLVADGSLVAWVELDDAGVPVYAVLDQATGTGVTRDSLAARAGMGLAIGARDAAVVFAVDDGEVYLRDSRGLVAWDPATGGQRELGDAVALKVDDVEDGQLAQAMAAADDGGRIHQVGPALGRGEPLPIRAIIDLSPDARHLIGEDAADRAVVVDTATGESRVPTVEGYASVAGYAWVDADTFVALGLGDDWSSTPVDLLTCDLGAACAVAVEDAGTLDGGLVVPFGRAMR